MGADQHAAGEKGACLCQDFQYPFIGDPRREGAATDHHGNE